MLMINVKPLGLSPGFIIKHFLGVTVQPREQTVETGLSRPPVRLGRGLPFAETLVRVVAEILVGDEFHHF